jgi:hypothetical protein
VNVIAWPVTSPSALMMRQELKLGTVPKSRDLLDEGGAIERHEQTERSRSLRITPATSAATCWSRGLGAAKSVMAIGIGWTTPSSSLICKDAFAAGARASTTSTSAAQRLTARDPGVIVALLVF